VGRYQFTHALIQETLLGELSLTRRVRLHARIAETLEALYGASAEAHAAELAHHFAEAQTVLGPEKLVRYSLIAGEGALASYGWEEALAHFQRGLAARGVSLSGTEPAKDGETAALLFGFGQARAATAERLQLQEVVNLISRAFEYYEKAGDAPRAVAVAEYSLPSTTVGRSAVSLYIPRALKLAPPDSSAAGRLLSSYGAELGRLENDYEGAQEAFSQALAIARRERDVALEVRTLAAAANVDFFHFRSQEALEKAGQAIELSHRLGDYQAAWSAHLDAFRALALTGDSGGARHHASTVLELAEKLRTRYRLAQALGANTALLRLQGNWQGTRDFSDRGLALAGQDNALLSTRVMLEYEVGDFDGGKVYLERLLETMPSAPSRHGAFYANAATVIACLARITDVSDRLDICMMAAQTVASSPLANPLFVLSARAGLGLVSVLRHDVHAASEHYTTLVAVRGSVLLYGISGDRVLGLLAQTMGNLDKAAQHFEDALAFCRKAGYRPELAWACCDYADCLLVRAHGRAPLPPDRPKAMALLDEALKISSELGMRPLMERVLSRREILTA
jgi:tetratricopeptide (TPR) repeat protein